jgi:glyoxylase-like metal-dependent hydrolase (beta-lactamase superfamily II)
VQRRNSIAVEREDAMTHLTRRTMLAGTAAVSAASLPIVAGTAIHAAAPLAGQQAPAWYRIKVGTMEVTVIAEGARISPLPDNFVRNKSREEVVAALQAAFLSVEQFMLPFNSVVVNTGSKLVAIDAGFGPGALATSKGSMGQGQANLKAAGIDINAIDAVIISHFHGDHINGLVTDGKPSFPNAEVMVPTPEWDFWMDDGNMAKAPEAMKGAFANVRRVFGIIGNKRTNYEPGKDVAPGIASMAAHGHSPGHTVHIVNSGNSSVMIQGDTTILPQLFVRNPGWHVMFDMDAPAAEATRRRVYDRLVADKMLVHGYHFPFPALAYIEKSATSYREIPVSWNPTI